MSMEIEFSTRAPEAAINTNVGMSLGVHSVLVRAWDTSGAYGDQT